MAIVKNTTESDRVIHVNGVAHTVPGGRNGDEGKFVPGTANIPDADLSAARKNAVVAVWFAEDHLAIGKAEAEKKPE
jgi:hypothetical protein